MIFRVIRPAPSLGNISEPSRGKGPVYASRAISREISPSRSLDMLTASATRDARGLLLLTCRMPRVGPKARNEGSPLSFSVKRKGGPPEAIWGCGARPRVVARKLAGWWVARWQGGGLQAGAATGGGDNRWLGVWGGQKEAWSCAPHRRSWGSTQAQDLVLFTCQPRKGAPLEATWGCGARPVLRVLGEHPG